MTIAIKICKIIDITTLSLCTGFVIGNLLIWYIKPKWYEVEE